MPLEPRRYTQEEIDELIACPKAVADPPRKEMKQDRGHFRNDMRLKSTDEKFEFRAFMRRSEDFPENFSIGLAFLPKDGTGELIFIRCNSARRLQRRVRPGPSAFRFSRASRQRRHDRSATVFREGRENHGRKLLVQGYPSERTALCRGGA